MNTIPSPAEAIASALLNPDPAAPLIIGSQVETQQQEQQPEKVETEKVETKVDEVPRQEAPKSLAESLSQGDVEPAKVEEKKDAPADEPREGEKPAHFIKRLKQERADLAAQLKQAQDKLNTRVEASPDEIAALRKELSEREELLEMTAFERSRKYQESFAKPLDKAATAAKDLISKFTETKGVYERAMALDGRERLDFLKEHVEDAAGAVFDRMARVDEISAERNAALKDREQISKANAEERQNGETAQILNRFNATREQVTKQLPAFGGEKGEEMWSQAKSLIEGTANEADIYAAAPLAVWAARVAMPELKALRAENATLKARIKEDGADRATINGRGTDTGKEANGFFKDGRVMPLQDVLRSQLGSQ